MTDITLDWTVTREDAIRAGRDTYGPVHITVAPSALTVAQRDELLRPVPPEHPDVSRPVGDTVCLPSACDALNYRIACRKAHEADVAKRAQMERDYAIKAYHAFCARHDADPVHCHSFLLANRLPDDMRADVQARLARAQRLRDERDAAQKEAHKAEQEKRTHILEAWLSQHGAEIDKARRREGYLSEDAIEDLMAASTFAMVNALYPERDDWTSFKAETATEEQFQRLQHIKGMLPDDAIVEIREDGTVVAIVYYSSTIRMVNGWGPASL